MFDAIIVGGGLAGLIAARDLRETGRSVLLLEARDRLGGRTWYRPFVGTQHKIELGGAWFGEEFMPAIAGEIRRYDLQTTQSPVGAEFRSALAGQLLTGDEVPVPQAERADLDRALELITAAAHRIQFGGLLDDPALSDLDVPFTDFLKPLDLPRLTSDYFLTWAGFSFGCHPEDVSALHVLSWVAGFDTTPWTLDDAPADKLADGTASLVDCIAEDGGAEIERSSPVASIRQDQHHVRVETRDGRTIEAGVAVLATPLNTWHDIEFAPELSSPKRQAARERHAGHGVKIWALTAEVPAELTAFGWGGGLNWISEQNAFPDGRLLVGLGTSPDLLDVSSTDDVEQAIRQFAPEASVLASDGHDWNGDEFSQGTWMAYRPGQVSRFHAAFQEPDGRLFFAGSDLAVGWAGFMDGAIESGATTAQRVDSFLGTTAKAHT